MPSFAPFDTICAIATPIGEGGIGIVKISGPDARPIASRLFRSRTPDPVLLPHRLHYGWIIHPTSGQSIDEVLLSYMATPHSYTREDVIEINCHSGFAVLQRILELVLAAGARLAEPGEFTRRAFLNGRIDLTQAEAVIETIRSQSDQSLAAANEQLRGGLRDRVEHWIAALTELHAQLEAAIDFADDIGDEPTLAADALADLVMTRLSQPVADMLGQYENGRIAREGLTLVLAGRPNVGKSSLLNALLAKDRAIVTALPGTTRDVIEDSFLLSGVMVRILDTAGIRNEPDTIEALGIERTFQALGRADVVLWMIDQSEELNSEDDAVFRSLANQPRLVLLNKADLPEATSLDAVTARYGVQETMLRISVLDPEHIEGLRNLLAARFLQTPLATARCGMIPNARHHQALLRIDEALRNAERQLRSGAYPELVSVEFQAARRALQNIVGRNADDNLLDQIFSQFCVGK